MSYTGTGLSRTNIISTFTFCDARGAANARGIVINNTGRPRLATDGVDGDVIVEGGDGDNVVCP
jgi:hypothetical protein